MCVNFPEFGASAPPTLCSRHTPQSGHEARFLCQSSDRGDGGLHDSGQSSLVPGRNQHPDGRLFLFRRRSVDEIYPPLLPAPFAVIGLAGGG
jgi:hypothetical protein